MTDRILSDQFNPAQFIKSDGSIDFEAAERRARMLRAEAVTAAALETGTAAARAERGTRLALLTLLSRLAGLRASGARRGDAASA